MLRGLAKVNSAVLAGRCSQMMSSSRAPLSKYIPEKLMYIHAGAKNVAATDLSEFPRTLYHTMHTLHITVNGGFYFYMSHVVLYCISGTKQMNKSEKMFFYVFFGGRGIKIIKTQYLCEFWQYRNYLNYRDNLQLSKQNKTDFITGI